MERFRVRLDYINFNLALGAAAAAALQCDRQANLEAAITMMMIMIIRGQIVNENRSQAH